MTGIEEFKNFFGGITILNVLEFGLAVAFLAFLYKKAKKYLIERHEAQVEKDQGLKKALEEVAKYPDYRKQSINVQNQLESEIGELRATIEANTPPGAEQAPGKAHSILPLLHRSAKKPGTDLEPHGDGSFSRNVQRL